MQWSRVRAGGLGEDRGKLLEDGGEEIGADAGLDRRASGSRRAAPAHPATATPEGHGEGAEIPQNRAQHYQPLGPQDDIVPSQRQGIEVPAT